MKGEITVSNDKLYRKSARMTDRTKERLDIRESAALNYLVTGNSENLVDLRNTLQMERRKFVEIISRFSKALKIFAAKTEDQNLMAEVTFSDNFLARLRHVDLIIKGRMILYYSRLYITGLAPYLINDDDLTEFEHRLKNFSIALNERQYSLRTISFRK